MQCIFRIQIIALKSHLSEVFLLMGSKKSVPLSESPTYPESQLSEVFQFNLVRKFKGPRNSVPVSKSPTYPGSHLTRVYCTFTFRIFISYSNN